MPNTNYKRGVRYEYKAKAMLEAEGFYVTRSAGSHGLYDLAAIDLNMIRLIQIKSTRVYRDHKCYREDFKKLSELLVPINCRKEFWVYNTKRRKWRKSEL